MTELQIPIPPNTHQVLICIQVVHSNIVSFLSVHIFNYTLFMLNQIVV